MARTNRPITSREYKLMLLPECFTDREAGIAGFRRVLQSFLGQRRADVDQEDASEQRRTWYVDTAAHDFRAAGLILRVREEIGEDRPFNITLKHRGDDRYLAAAHDFDSEGGEYKSEEDILAPYIGRFSYSRSLRRARLPRLQKLEDVRDILSGLPDLGMSNGTPLEPVNGFEASEIACQLVRFKPEGGSRVEAGLSFWYQPGVEVGLPWVCEFAMGYDAKGDGNQDELERFAPETVALCRDLFRTLQHPGWFSPGLTTKTAFAYEFGRTPSATAGACARPASRPRPSVESAASQRRAKVVEQPTDQA